MKQNDQLSEGTAKVPELTGRYCVRDGLGTEAHETIDGRVWFVSWGVPYRLQLDGLFYFYAWGKKIKYTKKYIITKYCEGITRV